MSRVTKISPQMLEDAQQKANDSGREILIVSTNYGYHLTFPSDELILGSVFPEKKGVETTSEPEIDWEKKYKHMQDAFKNFLAYFGEWMSDSTVDGRTYIYFDYKEFNKQYDSAAHDVRNI